VTHTIPLAAMPLLHHTRSVRRASGLVQTPFGEVASVLGRVASDPETGSSMTSFGGRFLCAADPLR
jgi:hypothetical protein